MFMQVLQCRGRSSTGEEVEKATVRGQDLTLRIQAGPPWLQRRRGGQRRRREGLGGHAGKSTSCTEGFHSDSAAAGLSLKELS